jgi:hypothetical protein
MAGVCHTLRHEYVSISIEFSVKLLVSALFAICSLSTQAAGQGPDKAGQAVDKPRLEETVNTY